MSVDYAAAGMLSGDFVEIGGVRSAVAEVGGGCVYAAAGARVWSASVGIVSIAGHDYPQAWLDRLESSGISIDGVQRIDRPHGPTLLASEMSYNSDGDRPALDMAPRWSDRHQLATGATGATMLDLEDPFGPRPAALPAGWATKGLHLASMSARAHASWLDAVTSQTTCVTLDSYWWHPGEPATGYLPMLRSLSALLPSKEEVSAFFDAQFELDMLRRLVDLGAPIVAVKLGRLGSAVLTAGDRDIRELPTAVAHVVDPTGAGDAFCGGFLVGLATTGDAVEAALHGTVSASFAVEGHGLDRILSADRFEASQRIDLLRKRIDA